MDFCFSMGKKSTEKKIHEKHTAKKQILRGFYVSFDPTENTMKAIHGNLKFTEIHDRGRTKRTLNLRFRKK